MNTQYHTNLFFQLSQIIIEILVSSLAILKTLQYDNSENKEKVASSFSYEGNINQIVTKEI